MFFKLSTRDTSCDFYPLLGFESSGEEIHGMHLQDQDFEHHLLLFRTSNWEKFLAKYFGFRICLGYFKKIGHDDYNNWYIFWCDQCKRFLVNYKQGFSNRLDCQFCQARFISGPFI